MKRLLFFIVVVIFQSSVSAQLIRGYGLKLGSTISNQSWEYDQSVGASFDPDNRTGLNIGVFAEFLDIPLLSVVAEVNYVQKGMKDEVAITTAESPYPESFITWDTRIDYLNLTALAKLRLNYGVLSPYLVLGPKIDFELNQDRSIDGGSIVEDEFNTSRFGLKVGIGTEVNLLPITFLVEILYDVDFDELYKNENLKVSSNSFDIRVGIMF
jgi:opacity protein-like surface antigen